MKLSKKQDIMFVFMQISIGLTILLMTIASENMTLGSHSGLKKLLMTEITAFGSIRRREI